ncbi:MAG: polymer-forming cytoskeletal protein [Polyangiales bacterium]
MSSWPPTAAVLLAVLVGCGLGCTEDLRYYAAGHDAGGAERPSTPPPAADAALSSPTPPPPRCELSVETRDGLMLTGGDACTQPRTRAFAYALCSCEDLSLFERVATDAFDSSHGAYAPGQVGGSVATNGQLIVGGGMDVQGELVAASAEQASWLSSGPVRVAGRAVFNTGLLVDQPTVVSFERDLLVNGDIAVTQPPVQVKRRLVHPETAKVLGEVVAASVELAPLEVGSPCACDAASVVDFVQLAQRFRAQNDNVTHAVDPTALQSGDLTLPCGRFLLEGGSLAGSRWTVQAHAVVFIDGDLTLEGPLDVDVGESGELDVFVGGVLTLGAGARLASARPGALRVYVGGASELRPPDGPWLKAHLYAPTSRLLALTPQELFGSLLVQTYRALAPTSVHYDVAVLGHEPSSRCPDAPCAAPDSCEDSVH